MSGPAEAPPHVSRIMSTLEAADRVTVSAADLRQLLSDRDAERDRLLVCLDLARGARDRWRARAEQAERRIADAIEAFERSAELADESAEAQAYGDGEMTTGEWAARASAFEEAARVLRGDAAKPTEPSDEDGEWHTGDDLPDKGKWAEVEVVDGQVLRGKVNNTSEATSMIKLIGPDAAPKRGGWGGVWATWMDTGYKDDETRVRWRYIPRPSKSVVQAAPGGRESQCDECGGTGGLHGQIDDAAPDCDACHGAGTTPEQRQADGGAEPVESDNWQTKGLPPLGAWVDVRVETGDVYTGEVTGVGGPLEEVQLSGPDASPWMETWRTWPKGVTIDAPSTRTGWRLAERPSDEQRVADSAAWPSPRRRR